MVGSLKSVFRYYILAVVSIFALVMLPAMFLEWDIPVVFFAIATPGLLIATEVFDSHGHGGSFVIGGIVGSLAIYILVPYATWKIIVLWGKWRSPHEEERPQDKQTS